MIYVEVAVPGSDSQAADQFAPGDMTIYHWEDSPVVGCVGASTWRVVSLPERTGIRVFIIRDHRSWWQIDYRDSGRTSPLVLEMIFQWPSEFSPKLSETT